MADRLREAFVKLTGSTDRSTEGVLNHISVFNHLSWLFGLELDRTE